jgi:hypothetical protein
VDAEIEDEPKVVEVCSRLLVLHGNERARTYFLHKDEFVSWALKHPPRGDSGARRHVTAYPTPKANRGWRFGSRY